MAVKKIGREIADAWQNLEYSLLFVLKAAPLTNYPIVTRSALRGSRKKAVVAAAI